MEILTSWIGPPIQDSFRDILPDNSPTAIARAVGLFRDRFATVGIFENEVYAGIPNALETLISSGHRLVLATSKPEPFAVRILEHFDLANYFTSVYGSSFDGSLSDKGELIAHALVQEALDPAAAVMVGDRKHDVLGAAKCGIPCVGVLYGYGSQQELQEAGAALLCETPADLPVVLQDATHLDAIWEPDRHSRY